MYLLTRINLNFMQQSVAILGKSTVYSIYFFPTNQVREEDMRDLLNQLLVPLIMMEDFNEHFLFWERKKIRYKYNLFCLNKKEETYYRTYDGCKSTIDITLANLLIAPEITCSKEYLRSCDHFPTTLKDEEIPTKHHQKQSKPNMVLKRKHNQEQLGYNYTEKAQ